MEIKSIAVAIALKKIKAHIYCFSSKSYRVWKKNGFNMPIHIWSWKSHSLEFGPDPKSRVITFIKIYVYDVKYKDSITV